MSAPTGNVLFDSFAFHAREAALVPLSRLAADARASATMALNQKTKELARKGVDVINLSIGEPDFDTPDNVKQAAVRAIQSGFTKYQPAAGLAELRRAIADKLRAENAVRCEPAEVLVSNGGKQALYMIMLSLVGPGDEVIVPAPYWVSYVQQVRFCGAEPVVADASGAEDLKPTPAMIEDVLTDRTRVLILNSPSNPTGAVFSRRELEAFVELALKHDLWIISDEIYEKLVYDGAEHVSPASFGDDARAKIVTLNGFSKTYAMTGWRIGWAAGPAQVIQAAARLQSHMTSGADSIAQKAAIEALAGSQDSVAEMRGAFDSRRRLMVDGLNRIAGLRCVVPQGAFYAFPDCRGLLGRSYGGAEVRTDVELCGALLEQANVAVVPGEEFGAPGFVRFHYAASEEAIQKALTRVQAFAGAGK